jgi:heme exporter protein B
MLNFVVHKNVYVTFAKVQFFILATIFQAVKFFLDEEWRNKYALIAILIYIFTAVLITFLALPGMDKPHFSAIFWIVVIFTTLQGISKAFISMKKGHYIFWHQLLSPSQFLIGKLITSFVLMFLFTSFALLIFIMIHGQISDSIFGFYIIALLTGAGIASIFTISSSIASKTDNPGVLLPVLTFPLIIPFVLIGVKAGKNAIDDLGFLSYLPELLLLSGFNVLVFIMGVSLIKFIWKD